MLIFAVRFAPQILYCKYAREARRKFWPFNFPPPPPLPIRKTDRRPYEYASELSERT